MTSKAGATGVPRMFFLWDGIPFEEMGIAGAVLSASISTSVGRTASSKKFKSGKPKVGAASITFDTSNFSVEKRLSDIIRVRQRPVISVAAGYLDGEVYWLGSFKMNSVAYNKPASGNYTTQISGEADKVLGMKEKVKPKVYSNRTLREILTEITEEHGLELNLDPDLNADIRLGELVRTAKESQWQFITRLNERIGSSSMHVQSYIEHSKELEPQLAFSNDRSVSRANTTISMPDHFQKLRRLAAHARNVLTVQRLPGFFDLSRMRSEKDFKVFTIAHGGRRDRVDLAEVDFLAESLTVDEETKYKGLQPKSGSTTPTNLDLKVLAVTGSANFQSTSLLSKAQAKALGKPAPRNDGLGMTIVDIEERSKAIHGRKKDEDRVVAASFRDVDDGIIAYSMSASSLPAEVDKGVYFNDRLLAIALANGFNFKLKATFNPGIPYLQAPRIIKVVGTGIHDGLWGVEESDLNYSSDGLTTSISCKPVELTKSGSKSMDEDNITVILETRGVQTFKLPQRGYFPAMSFPLRTLEPELVVTWRGSDGKYNRSALQNAPADIQAKVLEQGKVREALKGTPVPAQPPVSPEVGEESDLQESDLQESDLQ